MPVPFSRADWTAFLRLDNASVVDFLASTASVLAARGLLDGKEVDNLRLVLSGIQGTPKARSASVLLEMIDQKAEFLAVLEAWFGPSGFGVNLMRHTLRPHLLEIRRQLATFGSALLKKAELLFNRPIVLFDGAVADTRTVYATPLLDCADALAAAGAELEALIEKTQVMAACRLAGAGDDEASVDHEIALALGFSRAARIASPAIEEARMIRRLAFAIHDATDAIETLLKTIARNAGADGELPAEIACDWVLTECRRLASLELPKAGSLMAWEIRRANLGSALIQLGESLTRLTERTLETIDATKEVTNEAARAMPQDVHRRLAFDLISRGVAPREAWNAVEALLAYMRERNLRAREILEGELTKIHPRLTRESLDVLNSQVTGASLMATAGRDKELNMQRSKQLRQRFRALLDAGGAP